MAPKLVLDRPRLPAKQILNDGMGNHTILSGGFEDIDIYRDASAQNVEIFPQLNSRASALIIESWLDVISFHESNSFGFVNDLIEEDESSGCRR